MYQILLNYQRQGLILCLHWYLTCGMRRYMSNSMLNIIVLLRCVQSLKAYITKYSRKDGVSYDRKVLNFPQLVVCVQWMNLARMSALSKQSLQWCIHAVRCGGNGENMQRTVSAVGRQSSAYKSCASD